MRLPHPVSRVTATAPRGQSACGQHAGTGVVGALIQRKPLRAKHWNPGIADAILANHSHFDQGHAPPFMGLHHEQLGMLYRDHRVWLHGWLSGRVGNRDVADDLTQDTFARLLLGRDLAALREPRAFLTTVARGLAANWFRRQALERAYLEYLAQFPEPVLPSLEEQALVREALQQIDAMLDGLPAMARRVFLLAQFDGLRYEAIGEQLGLSLSTVKRHMKRALLGCLAHAG